MRRRPLTPPVPSVPVPSVPRRSGPGRSLVVGAVLVLGAALSACGADGSTDAGVAVVIDEGDAEAVVPADVGTDIHDVTAPVVGGGTISLTDYRAEPLALWFWAPT